MLTPEQKKRLTQLWSDFIDCSFNYEEMNKEDDKELTELLSLLHSEEILEDDYPLE